jgi:hypothetical protein
MELYEFPVDDHVNQLNYFHGAESFLKRQNVFSRSRISQHFMETKGSLPYSQELAVSQMNVVHTLKSYFFFKYILIL